MAGTISIFISATRRLWYVSAMTDAPKYGWTTTGYEFRRQEDGSLVGEWFESIGETELTTDTVHERLTGMSTLHVGGLDRAVRLQP